MKRPPPQLFLPEWFVNTICLIGKGKDCCIYLTVGENGYSCAKLIPNVKLEIDMRRKTFLAQGDNCPGTPMLNAKIVRNN